MTVVTPPDPGPRVLDRGRGWQIAMIVLAAEVAVVVGMSARVTPYAPLALALVVIIVVAVWRRPLVASILVASVVPAMAGLARGVPVATFKASEVLLVVCLVPLLLRRAVRWRRMNAVDIALIVVAIVGLALEIANGLTSGTLGIDGLLRTGLFPAFTFATWWVASRGVANRQEVDTVLRWVLLVSVVPALLGILQYFDVLGVRGALIELVQASLLPDPGTQESRITGPFPIAHSLGGYLIVPLMVGAMLLLRGRTSVLRRSALVAVVAIDAAALVLSVTLTTLAWAAAAFIVGAAVMRQFWRGLGVLVATATAVTLVFWTPLSARYEQQSRAASGTSEGAVPQTFQYRMLVWERDYLPLLAEAAPLGLRLQPGDVVFGHTENQYITLILRGGVGLLLITALSFIALARRASRATDTAEGAVGPAAAAIFGVLAFLPFACFAWPYVTNAGLPQSLFGVAGAVLALAGGRREWRKLSGPPGYLQGAATQAPALRAGTITE